MIRELPRRGKATSSIITETRARASFSDRERERERERKGEMVSLRQ